MNRAERRAYEKESRKTANKTEKSINKVRQNKRNEMGYINFKMCPNSESLTIADSTGNIHRDVNSDGVITISTLEQTDNGMHTIVYRDIQYNNVLLIVDDNRGYEKASEMLTYWLNRAGEQLVNSFVGKNDKMILLITTEREGTWGIGYYYKNLSEMGLNASMPDTTIVMKWLEMESLI